MLTFKRIVVAWILWCAVDLVAMGLLTTVGVVSVAGRPSFLPDAAQDAVWILVSLALAGGCAKLAWAKIK
jgi:hypothetical protein